MNIAQEVETLGKKTAITGGALWGVGELISSQLLTTLGGNVFGIGALARAASWAWKKTNQTTVTT